MKKQNGFIKILLVFIVLIFIVGIYFIYSKKGDDITSLPSVNHNNSSSASSPYPMKELTREEDLLIGTADWKTYRNDKYEFEFKYPSDYVLTVDTSTPSNQELAITVANKSQDYIHITLDKIPNRVWSADGIFMCDTKPSTEGCQYYKLQEKFNVNNIQIRLVSLSGDGGATARAQIVRNGILFDIQQFETDEKIIVRDIAETFRFTK